MQGQMQCVMVGVFPASLFFDVDRNTCDVTVKRSPALDPDGRTRYTVSLVLFSNLTWTHCYCFSKSGDIILTETRHKMGCIGHEIPQVTASCCLLKCSGTAIFGHNLGGCCTCFTQFFCCILFVLAMLHLQQLRGWLDVVVVAFLSWTLRVTQYVHPHLYMYKYRYTAYDMIACATVFNYPAM